MLLMVDNCDAFIYKLIQCPGETGKDTCPCTDRNFRGEP